MNKYKSHSFDIQIASEYGMAAAVLLESFYFWTDKNRSDGKHLHDGRYWTYSSVKALVNQYPYLSKDKIATAIKKLVSAGLLLEGSYNENPYDRTKWYALTDIGLSYYEEVEGKADENPNSIDGKSEMYNDGKSEMNNIYLYKNNNTDTKTDTYTCSSADSHDNVDHPSDDEFFESIWMLYPRKKGKNKVSKIQRKKLHKIGYDILSQCIDNYKREIELHGTQEQYIQHGSSFFNKGYEDYLPDVEPSSTAIRPKGGDWE